MAKLRIDIQGKIDTGLIKSIRELNTLLSQSANNLKSISSELGRTGAAFARTRTPVTAAAGSYREAQQNLVAMGRAIRNAEGGFNSTNPAIQQQVSAYRTLNTQLKEFDRNMGLGYRNVGNYGSGISGLTSSLGVLAAAYATIRTAISSVSSAFRSAMQTDALRTSFAFILDDSEERLARLRKQAELLGLQYVTLGNTYRKFIAATDASNFSLTQADKIFNAVANAGAKLKLSNEQVEGTFLAIEQMISKGTVSMEELRRQLGDRLPGAFGMAARAMGMTEEAFNKLVASGQVQAADLLPKLADEINKQYGLATENIVSLQASVNRLKNSFDLLVQDSNVQAFFRSVIDLTNQLVRSFGMLVTSRLSTELRDEQSALGSLRVELESTNSTADRRREIIEQLMAQYPHYLRDVDADKIKNGELLPILDRINDSYRDRIALQKRIEKHSLTFEQEASLMNQQFDAMRDVAERIAQIQDQIKGTGIDIPEGTVSERAAWIVNNLFREVRNLNNEFSNESAVRNNIRSLRTQLQWYNSTTVVLDRVSASADKARKEIQDFSKATGLTETEMGFIDAQKLADNVQEFYDVLNRARRNNVVTAQEYSGFEQRLKESGYDDATRRELLAEIERFELERRKKVVQLDKATLRERERLRKAGLKALAELTDTSAEQVTIEGTEAAKIEKRYDDLGKKAREAFDTALAGGIDASTALTAYTEKVNQLNIAKAAELARNQAKIEAKETEDRMRLLSNIRIQYERRANQDISQLVMNSINDRFRREVELANKLAKDQLWTEEQRLAKQQELQEKYWREVESIASISALKNAGFFALKEGLNQAEKDFNRFLNTIENEAERSRLKDLFKEYSNAIKDGASSNLARGLRDIGSELSGIVDIFTGLDQGFGRSLQALSRLADTYNRIAESIHNLTKSASNIATPFSANPWVSAIGAGLSLIGTIWDSVTSSKEAQKERIKALEEERKRISEFYSDASRGELSYQNLLRRREMDLARRAAGGDLYGIKAQIETAMRQIPEIEKEFERVFKRIQSGEYISGFEEVIGKELFFKNTWFGKVLKSRDAVIGYREALASLSDLDFDEIEQLFEEGKLTEDAKKDFEALRDLRDELEATGLSIEDLQRQMDQMLTGTTITSLADRIEQMFAAGTTSAEDFAKSFEEIMRDAMFSAFQAKYAVRYLEPFFEELAAQMDSEVFDTGRLERMYGDAANKYIEGLELLEQATGISLRDLQTGADPRGLTGSIERLSEQTGSELTGLYRATFELNKQELGYVQRLAVSNEGVLVAVQESADLLADIASTNAEIAENTAHLEAIAAAAEQIARNTDQKSMRDIGL